MSSSKWFRPTNLPDSLKVLKIITSLNGLFPFNFNKKESEISKLSIIAAIFHYFFYVISFILALSERHLNEAFFRSDISRFVSISHRITTFSITTFIFGFSLFQRKTLLRFIQMILEIDGIFQKWSLKLNYQHITNLTLLLASGIICFKITYNISCTKLFELHSKPSFLMQVVFVFPSVFKWIYILVFIVLVYILKMCLKTINSTLQNLIKTYSKKSSKEEITNKIVNLSTNDFILIKDLTEIHNIICDILKCIEKYFGFTILVIIGLHFFNIVFYCFYLLEIWFEPRKYFKSWSEYGLVSIILTQIIFANLQQAGFIEICQKSVRQNGNISMNIMKLLNLNIAPEMRDQLNMFALQLENREMRFSAVGVFNLDRTFYVMVRKGFGFQLVLKFLRKLKFANNLINTGRTHL